jgi:predicted RNase H-like HicB family nuclease
MKKTCRFKVVFEQDEDGIYIADVPRLPGCHSHGRTLKEAEKNIREAIEGYLEALAKAGDPIPSGEEPASFSLTKAIQVNLPI